MRCLLLVFFSVQTLFAAIPESKIQDEVAYSLREPHQLALERVRVMGTKAFSSLEEISFSEKWPMKTRWKALMLLSQAQGIASLPLIKKALVHKTWFMRSAGLTAMESLDHQGAKQWAYKLLHGDPALLVRVKAVEVLKQDRSEKVTELFWEKVYSKDSLHRDQSLWIRGDLARLLVKDPRKKDLKRWVRLLHEKDQDLQNIASLALKKIHSSPQEVSGSQVSVGTWLKKYPKKSL